MTEKREYSANGGNQSRIRSAEITFLIRAARVRRLEGLSDSEIMRLWMRLRDWTSGVSCLVAEWMKKNTVR